MFTALAIIAQEEKADQLLSFGIGAIALGILLVALLALAAFGGGREHS